MTIIPEACGDLKGMLRPSILKTLARRIKAHPDNDRAAMIEALRMKDINELENDARWHVKIRGSTMADAMTLVLARKYHAAKCELKRA